MAENPLVNVDLLKPATVFVEKISSAIGWAAAPKQIVRMARAEVEAERIRALGRLETDNLLESTRARLEGEEVVRQANIEAITARALPNLNNKSQPDRMEPDFIAYLFERARIVSDEEMQEIWGRILAGEANEPGSFARTTLDVLSKIGRKEAETFTNICRYIFCFPDPDVVIFTLPPATLPSDVGVDDLRTLQELDLVRYSPVAEYAVKPVEPAAFHKIFSETGFIRASYHGNHIKIYPSKKLRFLRTGSVSLTRAGRDLSRVCRVEPNEEVFNSAIASWRRLGHSVDHEN